MEEFVGEFKMVRAQTEGNTIKRFPSDPVAFIESHPGRLKEVVESRVAPSLIREGATKERIPLRGNNKRISNKRPSTQVASSPSGGTSNQELMQALLMSIIQSRSLSTSPPPNVAISYS